MKIIELYESILNEKFLTGKTKGTKYGGRNNYTEYFVNPTSSEFKEIETWARGVVLPNGDLYVISTNDKSSIHNDLLEYLKNNKIITGTNLDYWHEEVDSLYEFLCVQRGHSGNWLLAESYSFTFFTDKQFDTLFKKYEKEFNSKHSSKLLKKHSTYMAEKFLDMTKNGRVEIYVNPDFKEWKNILPWSRGIISRDGDLYIISSEVNIIHREIADALYNRKYIHTNDLYGDSSYVSDDIALIPIQVQDDSKKIYLSESYRAKRIDKDKYLYTVDLSDKQEKTVDKLFKKAKAKNPLCNFIKERIQWD